MQKYHIRGFTLIELLVVVLIIGILAAVAIPQYQKAVVKSRLAAIKPILKALKNAHELYYLENGHYLGYADNIEPLIAETNCTIVQDNSILKCDDFFLIDNISSTADVVQAAYCPGFQSAWTGDTNCRSNADFVYAIYLDHSHSPGKIECRSNTSLGQAVCKAEHL